MNTQLIPSPTISTDIKAIIDAHPKLADSTKAKYNSVIEAYQVSGGMLSDIPKLARFAETLSNSRKGHLKAALRLWSKVTTDRIDNEISIVKSQATAEKTNQTQTEIYRLEALKYQVGSIPTFVTVEDSKGEKAHTWLSQSEVKKLMSLPDISTPKGLRDKVGLGLMAAAGLRRNEAVNLTFDNIILQPYKGKIRAVIECLGKGDKTRLVLISDSLAACLDTWGKMVGDGLVLRSVNQVGDIGDSLSAIGLFKIVRAYGYEIGKSDLAPHDLRRTYAQIGYESGVPIAQISKLLGHASIDTTQRYLNLDLDYETTVSDFVPF